MIIVTYESRDPETPAYRRWLAQVEKISRRFYVTFHGASEEEARAKAQTFWDEVVLKGKPSTTDEPENDGDILV